MPTITTTVTSAAASGVTTTVTTTEATPENLGFENDGLLYTWTINAPAAKVAPFAQFDALGRMPVMADAFANFEATGSSVGSKRYVTLPGPEGVTIVESCVMAGANGHSYALDEGAELFLIKPGSYVGHFSVAPASATTCTATWTNSYLSSDKPTTKAALEGFVPMMDAAWAAVEAQINGSVKGVREGKCLLNKFGSTCSSFPLDGDSVTKEWLSAALNAPVTGFDLKVCSEGQVSNTILLTNITYQSGPGINTYGMPNGLALKMNKDEEATRAACSGMMLYSREVYFYSSGIQHEVPVKSPEVYAVYTDGSDQDEFNLIMLENMNDNWDSFSAVDGCPPLAEWVNILKEVQKIHVQYWKSPEIAKSPLSTNGTTFSMDDWRPSISMLGACLPVFEKAIREESYAGEPTLPSEWEYFFNFMHTICPGGDMAMINQFVDKLEAELGTRPMTLCHGDFNCGNFWEHKERKGEYCIADWQLLKMAPVVLDYITPFATIDTASFKGGKWKGFLEECHKGYAGTPIEEAYPFSTMIHDWKRMFICFWFFCVPILAGATQLPPGDKRDFTWKQMYPIVAGRFCTVCEEGDFLNVFMDYIKK